MILEYIHRKLKQIASAETETDRMNALYDIAAHGRIVPRERLSEISERYPLNEDEQQYILSWAQSQAGGVQ